MELNCLKARGLLRKDSLLFTDKFPGVSFFLTWLISEEWNAMMTYPKHLSKKFKKQSKKTLAYILCSEKQKITLKNAIFGILKTISKEVWKPDSFLHLPISIPTFVAFIFVFENSSNIFSCSIPCGLLRSYFCGKCIHGVHPKSI